jgi:predicted AAA+ superfamily ATPase
VEVASPAEPAAMAIGTLSTGDDATPQSQQRVQNLIASIGKRIATLSSTVAAAKRRQVGQVRNFLEQAQQALNSGDADGATNLATKARLLMDEVEKQ